MTARNGKPAVRLMAMAPQTAAAKKKGGFKVGIAKGRFKLPYDFEQINKELDKEIEDLFYAKPLFPPE